MLRCIHVRGSNLISLNVFIRFPRHLKEWQKKEWQKTDAKCLNAVNLLRMNPEPKEEQLPDIHADSAQKQRLTFQENHVYNNYSY